MSPKTINERISYFMKLKGLNATEFSKILGYKSDSGPEVSRILKGKPVGEIFVNRMVKAFPSINIDWILEGTGSMEKTTLNDIDTKYRAVKNIGHDPHGKDIPVLDTTVYAGIVSVLSGCLTLPPDTFIRIPIFSDGEAAVLVDGFSMKGYINHGDWVIIKRLTNMNSVMYGEAHLVVTKSDNLQTVKFLKPAEDEDQITLVPYNIEQFEPQTIYKDDIVAIYRVVGSFRSH